MTRSLELNPRDSEPLLERAKAYLEMGQYSNALDDATSRLQDKTADVYARRYRAEANLWLGRYVEALSDLDEIPNRDLDGNDLMLRGLASFGNGKFPNAIKELTRAISKDPHRADFYLARGCVYEETGDSKRAQLDIDEAIRRNPDYEDDPLRDSAINRISALRN